MYTLEQVRDSAYRGAWEDLIRAHAYAADEVTRDYAWSHLPFELQEEAQKTIDGCKEMNIWGLLFQYALFRAEAAFNDFDCACVLAQVRVHHFQPLPTPTTSAGPLHYLLRGIFPQEIVDVLRDHIKVTGLRETNKYWTLTLDMGSNPPFALPALKENFPPGCLLFHLMGKK